MTVISGLPDVAMSAGGIIHAKKRKTAGTVKAPAVP
jgi:hypothetical protein